MVKKPIGFNYESISKEHQQLVEEHARAINQHLRHTTTSMIDIGRRLIQIRQILGRVFKPWIGAEFEWSFETARNYMKLAELFGDLDCMENFRPSALLEISRRHVPQAAVDEAVARASSGELITKDFAVDLVNRSILSQFAASKTHSGGIGDLPLRHARPNRSIRSLKDSVKTFKSNVEQIRGQMSELERKSLADDLVELANQLIHEPIIEGDIETPDDVTESATVAFPRKQRDRRELATV